MTLTVSAFTNGQFSLQFSSVTGLNYVIEASSNLIDWFSVFTNAATNSTFIFRDTNAIAPQQFYRVKQ